MRLSVKYCVRLCETPAHPLFFLREPFAVDYKDQDATFCSGTAILSVSQVSSWIFMTGRAFTTASASAGGINLSA